MRITRMLIDRRQLHLSHKQTLTELKAAAAQMVRMDGGVVEVSVVGDEVETQAAFANRGRLGLGYLTCWVGPRELESEPPPEPSCR